jgi:hypothetical protein
MSEIRDSQRRSTKAAVTLAWVAVGIGVVAAALVAGRELRIRYRIRRRTPYDYFSHAGDEIMNGAEYGVGI